MTTSARRTSNGAALGGIGLLIGNRIEHLLADVEPISDRIIRTVFSGNPNLSVMANYAPVEGSEEAEELTKHSVD